MLNVVDRTSIAPLHDNIYPLNGMGRASASERSSLEKLQNL
jgi:hypothetical protein